MTASTTQNATNPVDVSTLSFEIALAELEKIVAQLEQGDVGLEDSIRIYERGEALKKRCADLLAIAEQKIEKITLNGQNQPTGTAPLDSE